MYIITGASGQVGSEVITKLSKTKSKVRAIVHSKEDVAEFEKKGLKLWLQIHTFPVRLTGAMANILSLRTPPLAITVSY